ncbi:MAG: winged helix-turn-helix domain-containing protein [Bacteroidota bacterium]
MALDLTAEQLAILRTIQKKERFRRRRFIKATVILMLHRDLSLADIQLSLSIDDNTIRRYLQGFLTKDLEEYLSDNYVPYASKLTIDQEETLARHLDEHLYLDVKPIIAWVEDNFTVGYTVSGMRDMLHRLGFTYKQTKAVPSKADEEAKRVFLEEQLPGLLTEVTTGMAEVYYADGVHPTHNTKTGRGWIRKGQDFEVDCNSGRKRVNINGAVRATKPEHLVYDVTDSINAQSTQSDQFDLLRDIRYVPKRSHRFLE